MTQKDKTLNCLNCRIGDFKRSLCDCHNGFCAKYKGIGTEKDFFKAIEELQFDRPQGEWIDVNGDGSLWRCSRCEDTACCNGNYCPACGAYMKGGDTE